MAYVEHTKEEYLGFEVVDATAEYRDGSPMEKIWVGFGGMEGAWLSPLQAEILAAKISRVTKSHVQRVKIG